MNNYAIHIVINRPQTIKNTFKLYRSPVIQYLLFPQNVRKLARQVACFMILLQVASSNGMTFQVFQVQKSLQPKISYSGHLLNLNIFEIICFCRHVCLNCQPEKAPI